MIMRNSDLRIQMFLNTIRRRCNSETDVVWGLYWFISCPVRASTSKLSSGDPRSTSHGFPSSGYDSLWICFWRMSICFWMKPIITPIVSIPRHIKTAIWASALWIVVDWCESLKSTFGGICFGRIPFISPWVLAAVVSSSRFLPLGFGW